MDQIDQVKKEEKGDPQPSINQDGEPVGKSGLPIPTDLAEVLGRPLRGPAPLPKKDDE